MSSTIGDYYHPSTIQVDYQNSGFQNADETDEEIFQIIRLFQKAEEENLKNNGMYVIYSFGAMAIFLLFSIFAPFFLVLAGASVGAAAYFYLRTGNSRLEQLSKVYWPIVMVPRPDGKRVFFDGIRELNDDLIIQTSTPQRAFREIMNTIQSEDSILKITKQLDVLLLRLSLEHQRCEKIPFLNRENEDFDRTFFGTDLYHKNLIHHYEPEHILWNPNELFDLDQSELLVNNMNKLDKYSKEMLLLNGQMRSALVTKVAPFKNEFEENINNILSHVEQEIEVLEKTQEELFITFSPVRNLLRRQFEPRKILLEVMQSMTESQLEMSNFIYSQTLRKDAGKEERDAQARSEDRADQVFGSIDEMNRTITKLTDESNDVENAIRLVREEIQKLQRFMTEIEGKIRDLESQLSRAQLMDNYSQVSRLRTQIDVAYTERNNTVDRLNSLNQELNNHISRLERIGREIRDLKQAKREAITKQRDAQKRAIQDRTKRATTKDKYKGDLSNKVRNIMMTNEKFLDEEINLMRQILASVDIAFNDINQLLSLLKEEGLEEELRRKLEGHFSTHYYLISRMVSLVMLLHLSDDRYVKANNKREANYLKDLFPGESEPRYQKPTVFLLPLWLARYKDSEGMNQRDCFCSFRVRTEEPRVLFKDLPVEFINLNHISPNIVSKFANFSPNYQDQITAANLLQKPGRRDQLRDTIENLKQDAIISGRAAKWLQAYLEV